MVSCNDCLDNNCPEVTSDGCVKYTGDPIPILGICTGDTLSKVEEVVINALLTSLDGTGITPANVTLANCPWLLLQFGTKNPTLSNLLQLLIDSNCTLKGLVDALQTQIAGANAVFDLGCLASSLPANAAPNQILQGLITAFCATSHTVTQIPGTYVQTTDLTSLVTTILQNLGLIGGSSGPAAPIQYSQYFPPNVAMPYFGSLSVFDNTGAGLPAVGFQNLFLCNGVNGTPDLRGRTIVGAIRNVPGGTLDSAVDPSNPLNPNTNYGVGDRFGESSHRLVTLELPAHTHSISDPGHSHVMGNGVLASTNFGPYKGVGNNGAGGLLFLNSTNIATTGIIGTNQAGGGDIHNNVQPSAAAYWVIRL